MCFLPSSEDNTAKLSSAFIPSAMLLVIIPVLTNVSILSVVLAVIISASACFLLLSLSCSSAISDAA